MCNASLCVVYVVCVCRPISYFMVHIQTMHPKTHRATHISPGSHECGESGLAIGRVQAFSFVTFKVQVYDFFSRRGGQPILTPSSPNRSLGAYLLLAKPVSYQDRYNQHSCVPIPSPFTARWFQGMHVDDRRFPICCVSWRMAVKLVYPPCLVGTQGWNSIKTRFVCVLQNRAFCEWEALYTRRKIGRVFPTISSTGSGGASTPAS